VNQTDMLHQMCQSLLSEADVKAICKNRGLPGHAASSPSVLESLFLSDTGVAAAMASLEPGEIALLHLLNAVDKPVDVAFFSLLNPPGKQQRSYGTFTQRFQGVLTKVKERLVRRGVLIQGLARQTPTEKTNMERWRFALPVQFSRHLPALLQNSRRLEGEGDWRSHVARDRLRSVASQGSHAESKGEKLEIVDGQLRFAGQPFRAGRFLEWQKGRWLAETAPAKGRRTDSPHALSPAEAVTHLLAELDAGLWADMDALAVPLEMFCGFPADSKLVCESGWRWGCLARQEAEGKIWYRLAPPPPAEPPPDEYLTVLGDGSVAVDLETVGFEALEKLVAISDQRAAPHGRPALLVTPKLVELGRAAEEVLALPVVDWLRKNSAAFRQALETVQGRRGRTIVHENLSVARVGDLALKVALEKALGGRMVSLGEDAVAFPREALAEVTRIVTRLGHVVKEVSHHGS